MLGLDIAETSAADDHMQIDLSKPDCGERFLGFCGDREVDGLVNNAGIGLDEAAVDTTPNDFGRVLNVNLRAPFLLASALQPVLARQRGFVVNIASVHAVATSHLVAVYAASKGGLVSLTRALALEWAPQIHVNTVLPGAVKTQMLTDGLLRTQSSLTDVAERHPLGRVGSPDEIAHAVAFLATNSFASGIGLTLDGGATARLSTE